MPQNLNELESIRDIDQLDELLSEPTEGVIDTMRRMKGDLLILGVGGKMGPTLARMAKRASDIAGVDRRVIGVSRFSDDTLPRELESHGVETIRCDLLDPNAVRQLPDAPNVLYMVGLKFGTQNNQALTWAMNTVVPTVVAQRYAGANTVAMSTGNVYGLYDVTTGGARETDPLRPVGEYAMSAVGRERVFEFFANQYHTPTALIRLYYAVEMRYGVPVDIAQWVYNQQPINLSMGYASMIWQGDANAHTLQAFDHAATPARPINVAGPSIVNVRDLAERFGKRMGIEPIFQGEPENTALVCNTSQSQNLFGQPRIAVNLMVDWIADWVMRDQPRHGKPTHFENRIGDF
jgi:nucleoside-diphosphate-sugar epimerase